MGSVGIPGSPRQRNTLFSIGNTLNFILSISWLVKSSEGKFHIRIYSKFIKLKKLKASISFYSDMYIYMHWLSLKKQRTISVFSVKHLFLVQLFQRLKIITFLPWLLVQSTSPSSIWNKWNILTHLELDTNFNTYSYFKHFSFIVSC